jgi:Sulfotransferase domain
MRPNFIVIGAQKCGTSALHHYLRQHPDISMSKPKELNFFIDTKNWDRGVSWYELHWPEPIAVRGEVSPNYTAHPHFGGVPERMHSVVPEARLIFLVRDPIQRVVSQYVHNYTKRAEHRDIRTSVLDSKKTYLNRSRYMFQLEQFLPYYEPDNILVIDSGSLRDERLPTLRRIFRFLGVDDAYDSEEFKGEKHRTADKERLNRFGAWSLNKLPRPVYDRMRRRLPRLIGKPIGPPELDDSLWDELAERLKEDADRLREFTGDPFSSWQV